MYTSIEQLKLVLAEYKSAGSLFSDKLTSCKFLANGSIFVYWYDHGTNQTVRRVSAKTLLKLNRLDIVNDFLM